MTSLPNPASWLAGYIADLPTSFDADAELDLGAFERNSGHVDVDVSLRRFASFVGKAKYHQDWYGQIAFGDRILPGRACDAFGWRAARRTGRAKNSDLFLLLPLLIGSTSWNR
jgi:hypothetical protein